MGIRNQNGMLKCPYEGCRKRFDKPTVLTDSSTALRQTHYACPYCNSRIDLVIDKMRIVNVRPTEYPTVFQSPAKCSQYTGLLNSIPDDAPIPDDCLICPKVLQCKHRKR